MVQTLWSLIGQTKDNNVINSVLTELSKFKKDAFKCSYLPENILTNLKMRNKKIINAEENKEKPLDDIFPCIPALSYIDLFNSISTYQGCSFADQRVLNSRLVNELNSKYRSQRTFQDAFSRRD